LVIQKPLNLDRLGETNDHVNANYELPPLELLAASKPVDKDMTKSNQENQQILDANA